MKHTDVFNKWYSERMGHPLGVQLGKNAVDELVEEVSRLGFDKTSLIKTSGNSNKWLRRRVEHLESENLELIELTKEIGATLSSYEFMKPSEKVVEIEKIKMAIDKLLNK